MVPAVVVSGKFEERATAGAVAAAVTGVNGVEEPEGGDGVGVGGGVAGEGVGRAAANAGESGIGEEGVRIGEGAEGTDRGVLRVGADV
jgi:hypothetical protein